MIEKHNVYALELDGHEWETAPSLLTYTRDVMMNVPSLLNELFPKAKISTRVSDDDDDDDDDDDEAI